MPWYLGGPTNLDNLTLVCGYHHREFDKRGWRVVLHQGLPTWIPPAWIDPEQAPQRNTRITGTGMSSIDAAVVHALADKHERDRARHGPPPSRPDDYDGGADRGRDSDSGDDGESPLDSINDLADLLALHITAEEREEFHYELDLILDGYLRGDVPSNPLKPAA